MYLQEIKTPHSQRLAPHSPVPLPYSQLFLRAPFPSVSEDSKASLLPLNILPGNTLSRRTYLFIKVTEVAGRQQGQYSFFNLPELPVKNRETRKTLKGSWITSKTKLNNKESKPPNLKWVGTNHAHPREGVVHM